MNYKNRNMSFLPLNQRNLFLDAEFIKAVLWINELINKINQVSFLSDVGDFDTSLDLKLDTLVSRLRKNSIMLNMIILPR